MNDLKIILQGGGTRCSYQVTFLDKLINNDNFHNKFNIKSIYGTSFGALVGYFFCVNKLHILDKFFKSIDENSLKRHFDLWGFGYFLKRIPIIGKIISFLINIIWLLKSVANKSLYNQSNGIGNLFNNELTLVEKENLKKFNCCVYNITKQKVEYINGTHPLIIEYILASSSLWIVFEPKLIKQLKSECICDESCKCSENNNEFCTCEIENHRINEYMDGGVLKPIPYEYDKDFKGKHLILTTKDIERINNKKFIFTDSGENLFEYLDNIITFLIEYNQHVEMNYVNKGWYKNDNVHLVNYKPKSNNPAILDKKIIEEYMNDGEELANEYLTTLT